MKDACQYGLLENALLDYNTCHLAYKYVRLRVLPFNELGYEDTVDYGIRRSDLHSRISESLDLDRELVERAFADVSERFGARTVDGIVVDGSFCIHDGDDDLVKLQDAFCDQLEKYASQDAEKRHPNALTENMLDEISENKNISGLPSLS